MAIQRWTPLSAAGRCKRRIKALRAKAEELLLACSNDWSDEDGFLEREFADIYRDLDQRLSEMESAIYDAVRDRT